MSTKYPDLSKLSVNQLLAITIRESADNQVIKLQRITLPSKN